MASYMKMRDLTTGGKRDLQGVLGQAAKRLGECEDARVQFRVLGRNGWTCGAIQLSPTGSEVVTDLVDLPDLEIITDEKTAKELAKGAYSPLKAFIDGNLRVRGDFELGRRILKQLGTSGGEIDIF